ncbi:MAG: DUF4296 domain-containing protein [Saprospiraceae bacterium]|nr:DUF4296 domain-containing protein [Saprospiraceae bacterium]
MFLFVSISIVTFSSSCRRAEMEPPAEILTDSVLVNILTDSYILNAAFNQTAGTIKDSVSQAYSQQILDKYHISQEVLEENVEWRYAQERMDTIFNMMMERMNYLEDHIPRRQ